MKNTDIAMVILIAAVSVAVSYFLGNAILGDPNDKVENLEYMNTISGTIDEPDDETFNPKAKNPTVEVYVGNCGPLEVWNEEERICKLRPEFGGETEKDESEDEDESEKTDSDSTEEDTTESDDSTRSTGGR